MDKEKRINVKIELRQSKSKFKLYTRVTYDKKDTTFVLPYRWDKKPSEKKVTKIINNEITQINRAIRHLEKIDKDFSISGFGNKYHILSSSFLSQMCLIYKELIYEQLGYVVFYNEYLITEDLVNKMDILEDNPLRFHGLEMINLIREKFNKSIFKEISEECKLLLHSQALLIDYFKEKDFTVLKAKTNFKDFKTYVRANSSFIIDKCKLPASYKKHNSYDVYNQFSNVVLFNLLSFLVPAMNDLIIEKDQQ